MNQFPFKNDDEIIKAMTTGKVIGSYDFDTCPGIPNEYIHIEENEDEEG
jgi:hypothetical protein